MAKLGAHFGLMLPNRAPAMGYSSAAEIISHGELADQAEVIDHVWVGDSLLAKPRLEALCLLSALAARTNRVRLGTAALASLPLRHPILLALQWATMDAISNGRMIMGAAIGGAARTRGSIASEYDAFGVNPRERTERAEEGIALLRLLWSGNRISFAGKHWDFDQIDLGIIPHQEHPPIWLVSSPFETGKAHLVQRGLRRVAKYADGWMASRLTPDQFRQGCEVLDTLTPEYARDGATIEKCFCGHLLILQDKARAFADASQWLDHYYVNTLPEETVRIWTGLGPPEECARWIQSYIDAGAQHVLLRFASYNWDEQFDAFVNSVVPMLGNSVPQN